VKTRKVIHITRSAKGGVPVVVDQLVRGLNRNKYEPIVAFETNIQSDIRQKLHESNFKTINLKRSMKKQISIYSKPRKNFNISNRIEKQFGKRVSQFYFTLKHFKKFIVRQVPRIKPFVKVFKENRVDLVHTHSNLYLGKPEVMAASILGIPCVSHNHGYFNLTHFDKLFAHLVNKFIYISKDVAQFYISMRKPQFERNGIIIHNGIDMRKFALSYNADSIRDEFGIKPDQPLAGIIGRMDSWKGHDYFLEAISKANKQISDLKGLIIGDFETDVAINYNRQYMHKLKKLIRRLGLKEKIIFAGYRNDVPRIISALDVVVHASSTPEPFGIVIIEGMAAGKPVIATASGGVLDIIEDGVNGILVPCQDSDAMAKAIVQIISNPDQANKIGMAGYQCVKNKFTIENQIRALEELYDSIL
jgi:glycosyltransferase involved in cell wall biosynthesis